MQQSGSYVMAARKGKKTSKARKAKRKTPAAGRRRTRSDPAASGQWD